MSSTIGLVGTILGVLGGLLRLLDLWFPRNQQAKILADTMVFCQRLSEYEGNEIERMLLRALVGACDVILGKSIWSRQAMLRVATLSLLFFAVALNFAGVFVGEPFGMPTPPWVAYDQSISTVLQRWGVRGEHHQVCMQELEQCEGDQQQRGIAAQDELIRQRIERFSAPHWKWIYTVALFGVTCLVAVFLNILSMVSTRVLARSVLETENRVLRNSVWLVNFAIILVLSSFAIFLIAVLSTPWTWGLVALTVLVSSMFPVIAVAVLIASTLGAWALSGTWIKVVALTAIAPGIALAIAAPIGAVFPRSVKSASRRLSGVLAHAAGHEKALFALLSALVLGVAGILGGVAALLAWIRN